MFYIILLYLVWAELEKGVILITIGYLIYHYIYKPLVVDFIFSLQIKYFNFKIAKKVLCVARICLRFSNRENFLLLYMLAWDLWYAWLSVN